MTQTITLTRVGNSKAVIIPAKILKAKVMVPEPDEQEMESFLASLYRVPAEDIANDERLAYILSK